MAGIFAGAVRWGKRTAAVVLLLATVGPRLHAQYNFIYTIWANYTPSGDGTPFSDMLCTGLTPNINYDNNPATPTNPYITDLCPAVGPAGLNYGAQFFAYMFTWVPGNFTFYVGSDDGSRLYVDGVNVLDMPGNHSFQNNTVSVFLGALSHTFLLDYYANDVDDFHGKAIQATVDPRLNVTPYDESLLFHGTATPEPSSIVLLSSGLAVIGAGAHFRRRRLVANS